MYTHGAYASTRQWGLNASARLLNFASRRLLCAAALCLSIAASPAHASKCEAGTVFNPITKVRWTCIFPITIGGVRVGPYDKLDKALDAQSASAPLCACRKGATFWFGIKISFWSPDRMVDVVTEPGCMMALGADIMSTGGKLQGSQTSIADGTNTRKLFAQMHYYISPVWKMLDMFTDLPCFRMMASM
jgi:conjugal transfer pilus assembly protein TraU